MAGNVKIGLPLGVWVVSFLFVLGQLSTPETNHYPTFSAYMFSITALGIVVFVVKALGEIGEYI